MVLISWEQSPQTTHPLLHMRLGPPFHRQGSVSQSVITSLVPGVVLESGVPRNGWGCSGGEPRRRTKEEV